MQVCYMMLQNVLSWLHACCMGLVGEEAGARNLGFSRAMKGTSSCAADVAAVVPDIMGFSSVFCNEWWCLCA